MGIDLDALVAGARAMETACRLTQVRDNPGLALGAIMGAGALAEPTRDKLTLLLPARLASFGLWVEQLVAESTGKHDKGVVPIAGESARMSLGSGSHHRLGHRGRRDTGRFRPRPCQSIGRAGRDDPSAGCARAGRGVPAMGNRHGDGRPADGDQSVRRAQREAGEGRHRGTAQRLSAEQAAAAAGAARHDRRRTVDAQRRG